MLLLDGETIPYNGRDIRSSSDRQDPAEIERCLALGYRDPRQSTPGKGGAPAPPQFFILTARWTAARWGETHLQTVDCATER